MFPDHSLEIPSYLFVMAGIGAVILTVGLVLYRMDKDLRILVVIFGGMMFGSCFGLIFGDLVFFPDLYRW